MNNWYVMLSGDAYAMSIYPTENNWKSAREFVLEWLGVNRLPNGTEIWRG